LNAIILVEKNLFQKSFGILKRLKSRQTNWGPQLKYYCFGANFTYKNRHLYTFQVIIDYLRIYISNTNPSRIHNYQKSEKQSFVGVKFPNYPIKDLPLRSYTKLLNGSHIWKADKLLEQPSTGNQLTNLNRAKVTAKHAIVPT
jgi:hypothetical protein